MPSIVENRPPQPATPRPIPSPRIVTISCWQLNLTSRPENQSTRAPRSKKAPSALRRQVTCRLRRPSWKNHAYFRRAAPPFGYSVTPVPSPSRDGPVVRIYGAMSTGSSPEKRFPFTCLQKKGHRSSVRSQSELPNTPQNDSHQSSAEVLTPGTS